MKNYFTLVLFSFQALFHVSYAQTGKVGINTVSPTAMLHVKDSSVVFTGGTSLPSIPGQPPVSGVGIRMMWYPDKAAFRAGLAIDNSWNKDSIGSYSIAMGRSTKAIGLNSTAFGYSTKASASYSTALGISTLASGYASLATGYSTEASNNYATAMGYNTTASGTYTTTMGYSTIASGTTAIAMGTFTTASNSYATAMGHNTTASGSSATAMGAFSTASGSSATAMGNQTTASGTYSTTMGFGTNASEQSATAMGYNTSASGNYATTMGYNTSAYGSSAIAMGSLTSAYGSSATAMGYNTTASGAYATSLGHSTIASGYGSTAMGYFGKASGYYSNAMGYATMTKSFASVAIGRYNDTTSISSVSWNTADPVFIIGNGSSNTSRSNAFTVLKNGKVGIKTAVPEYGLHMTSTDAADGGWVDGLVIQNTSSSTGEAAISMRNSGSAGTGAKFWHVGLNQDRNFRWCYGTGFLGADTKMSLDSLGNLTIVGVYSPSDATLKTGIYKVENALDKILLISGYHYYWKDPVKDPSLHTGLMAQEIENVMPELVKTDDDGMKSVNYDGLIPFLVEAVKTLKEENEQIKSELVMLKSLLDD